MFGQPDEELCPRVIQQSLDRYAREGVPTGDFLRAVLENDLREAIGRADYINMQALPHIVAYCWNRLPSGCWGSPEAVKRWLSKTRQ